MTINGARTPGRIVLCAKSAWDPPIRREHALATAAAADGHEVVFVERPDDIRALRGTRSGARYLSRLAGEAPVRLPDLSLSLARRATLVPGHRGALWRRIDNAGLRRQLERTLSREPDTAHLPTAVVANLPWQWPAVAALPGVRKVVDLADDWTRLMPMRRDPVHSCYRRIAEEADEVIVAAPELADLFGGRDVTVVRNATGPELLSAPVSPPPGRRHLVYLGTLSERFDASLVGEVLTRLPDWTLSLYGPCQYAGCDDRPGPALMTLLSAYGRRVRWHGPVPRTSVASVLDSADVLILPNDPAMNVGQDSMKLYDYAARGRPVVATPLPPPDEPRPPGIYEVASPEEFAAAVVAAPAEPATWPVARRSWAERNSWPTRLPVWLTAVFGQQMPDRPLPADEVGRRTS